MTAQTESQRAELVIHNHKRARGEVHTWHVERAGEVLLRDTTRRSPLAGISKRRQVAGAFGRLVVQTPQGYRWELPCPFDPREVAVRSPRFFRTREAALEGLAAAAAAVEQALSGAPCP